MAEEKAVQPAREGAGVRLFVAALAAGLVLAGTGHLRMTVAPGLDPPAWSRGPVVSPAAKSTRDTVAKSTRARAAWTNPPLSFEANAGQTDPRVDFIARGRGFSLFLTSGGATLRLHRDASKAGTADAALAWRLVGGNPRSQAEGLDQLPGKSNYFLGRDPARWRSGISRYARVKYAGVYPGIDLVFYGNQHGNGDGRQGGLEYDFVVEPGADSREIRLQIDGADAERIDENGDLLVRVGGAEIRQLRPVVYQDWDDARHYLPGRYVLRGASQIGFEVTGYRSERTLVIDPVLAYSSFLGGSNLDVGHSVAVDANDNVYLTGATVSIDFPTVVPEQPANAGGFDAFVTKLDPTGTVVLFSTYLGGSGQENNFNSGVESSGIAVDSAGNVYLAGRTNSIDFPVWHALFGSYRGGDEDGFVAKLSADGSTLLYSTYLGGEDNDSANGIAVDSMGNAYVTGGTKSANDFPISQNAFEPSWSGLTDAYIVKIDPTQTGLASLLYASYLGGLGTDRGTGVAVDSAGRAYVVGRTDSGSDSFPLVNPIQPDNHGLVDAFVAVVDVSGTGQLVYSTFLGGSGFDVANAVAVDSLGDAFVVGETASTDFPGTANGAQPANAGSSDAFVAALDPTGSTLLYATYLGGSGLDRGTGIALDGSGLLSMTGETSSGDFPRLNAFQAALGGGKDAFVARVDPSQQGANSLLYSSYLGGSGDDFTYGIAVNSAGDAWVVGQTASAADFPTVNPVQPMYGGGVSDAFVARISGVVGVPDYSVSATPSSAVVTPGNSTSYMISVTPVGGFIGSVDLSVSGLPSDSMASFDPPTVVITDSTPQTSVLTVSTAGSTPVGTFPLSIAGSSGPLQHMTSVTLVVTNATDTADLSLTATAWPSPVAVQTNLTYTIRITNLGPAVATGVQVTDTLPAVVFVSAASTEGTCSGTSTVSCSLGMLDAGAGATITIVVTPPAIGSISNTATVTGDQPDPNPNNNSATVVTSVVATGGMPGDVLQHHRDAVRDGLYIDPLVPQAAAGNIHLDPSFNAAINGPVHAQPLYVNNGPGGTAAYIVATEQDDVVALDASDGTPIWLSNLGAPVPLAQLPCGDIDPLGITGTPVIDLGARVVFVDAMTTPDGGVTKQHLIYALSLDDGSVVPGWPVDVNGLSFGGLSFDSTYQNQRGALLLNAGVLYVPYGGHFGDCPPGGGEPNYHGWVVAVPENDPGSATAWATDGVKAGIWAVGGLSTDGTSIFAATGNTAGASDWMGGEAVLRLGLDDTFSGNPADFFTPSNWFTLDQNDLDLGGETPMLLDVPGATPSQLVLALGKSGVAHLLDRSNLGGIGTGDGENGEGLYSVRVAIETGDPPRGRIRTAAATYTTASGTYVVFSVSTPGAMGFGCPATPGDLVALQISASSPPTISVAWCADNHGRGAPIVTTTDGSSQPVVWTIGAEGTNRLYAYNGETGDLLFAGGGPNEQMTQVSRFQTPIAVNGHLIVAADGRLYVFTTQ